MSDQNETPPPTPSRPSLDDTVKGFVAALKWAQEHPEEALEHEQERQSRLVELIHERTKGRAVQHQNSPKALFDEAARRIEAALGRAFTSEERELVSRGPVKGAEDVDARRNFERRMHENCNSPEEAKTLLAEFYGMQVG